MYVRPYIRSKFGARKCQRTRWIGHSQRIFNLVHHTDANTHPRTEAQIPTQGSTKFSRNFGRNAKCPISLLSLASLDRIRRLTPTPSQLALIYFINPKIRTQSLTIYPTPEDRRYPPPHHPPHPNNVHPNSSPRPRPRGIIRRRVHPARLHLRSRIRRRLL